jgi:hypothetical protein
MMRVVGTMLEETTRWYLEEISRWLYDGMGAQADTDSMNIFIKQYKEETSLRARRWKDKMAQSFWNFCADGQGREIRLTQRYRVYTSRVLSLRLRRLSASV